MRELQQPYCDSLVRTRSVPACPVCSSTKKRACLKAQDHLLAIPGVFEYSKCDDCGTVFQDPCVIRDDLVKCYTNDYFTHQPQGNTIPLQNHNACLRARFRRSVLHYADGTPKAALPAYFDWAARLVSIVPPLRKRARYGLPDELAVTDGNRRCLEIGPGRGTELRLLRQIGWHPVGLEIDPVAADLAENNSGCKVHVGQIESADFVDGQFSMIYMNHVVEHLSDLRASLARCHEWLSDGGRLVLVYPNPRSLVNRTSGRYSPNWDAPRHLVLAPSRTMTNLLKHLGFSWVKTVTSAHRTVGLRLIARHYRAGNTGWHGLRHPSVTDQLFGFAARILVGLGVPVGEEIRVIAVK